VIDVSSHIEIERPREQVGAYTLNLDNARKWVGNLRSLDWITPPPLAVRSRIGLVTELFGQRLKAAYEIVSLAPAERLVMRADDPFPIEMRYILESITASSTRMTIRARIDPGGFLTLLTPIIANELRALYRDDLLRLKKMLET
jgi:Polyketide cyclase / dehydrase and lipid transport